MSYQITQHSEMIFSAQSYNRCVFFASHFRLGAASLSNNLVWQHRAIS